MRQIGTKHGLQRMTIIGQFFGKNTTFWGWTSACFFKTEFKVSLVLNPTEKSHWKLLTYSDFKHLVDPLHCIWFSSLKLSVDIIVMKMMDLLFWTWDFVFVLYYY